MLTSVRCKNQKIQCFKLYRKRSFSKCIEISFGLRIKIKKNNAYKKLKTIFEKLMQATFLNEMQKITALIVEIIDETLAIICTLGKKLHLEIYFSFISISKELLPT